MVNCNTFNGGYCDKIDANISRTWCLTRCKYYNKEVPENIKEEIEKEHKQRKANKKPQRTKEQQAYLIQYCGQVCGKLHDKKPSCGVTKCKIKGSFVCPEGKWNELNIIHTAIPTQETEPLELKD